MSFSVFGEQSNLLPAFSKPYADELLSSWLTRLSFDHGLNRSALIRLMGITCGQRSYDWSIDRLSCSKMFDQMAGYVNCTAKEIRNATVWCYENKLFSCNERKLFPGTWAAKRVVQGIRKESSKANMLYCPSCLAKPGNPVYYKKQWRLSISFVCLECNCYLRECCPHCGKGSSNMNDLFSAYKYETSGDYLLACGHCEKDISQCDPERAPEHLIIIQRKLNTYLEQSYSSTPRYSVGYFNLLNDFVKMFLLKKDNTPLRRFIQDVYEQSQTPEQCHESYSRYISDLQMKQRADVFSMACWLLDEWPHRFVDLCGKHLVPSKAIIDHINQPPRWFSSQLVLLDLNVQEKKAKPYAGVNTWGKPRQEKVSKDIGYDYDFQEAYYNENIHLVTDEEDDDEEEYKDLYDTLSECLWDTNLQKEEYVL